jgi:hypothetical protein
VLACLHFEQARQKHKEVADVFVIQSVPLFPFNQKARADTILVPFRLALLAW